jgi:hypothetical protein
MEKVYFTMAIMEMKEKDILVNGRITLNMVEENLYPKIIHLNMWVNGKMGKPNIC